MSFLTFFNLGFEVSVRSFFSLWAMSGEHSPNLWAVNCLFMYVYAMWCELRLVAWGKYFVIFTCFMAFFGKFTIISLTYSKFTPKIIYYIYYIHVVQYSIGKSNISKKWKIGHPYVCLKSTSRDFFGDLTHWWKNSVSHYSWTNSSV